MSGYQYKSPGDWIHHPENKSAVKAYMDLAVGSDSYMDLFKYEVIHGLLSSTPGGLGYLLRQKLYPRILGGMGSRVSIGRYVSLRGPGKICIGNNVIIEDNCNLVTRGKHAKIIIGDNIIISRNTILRTRGEAITIGDGSSIGSNCLIGTDSRITIGKDVLIAAFCHLTGGGGHNFSDPRLPIIKQGITTKGGINIGDGAWVGAKTAILDGAKVHEGAIVGASSMVNCELAAMSISYGTPARVVRMRTLE